MDQYKVTLINHLIAFVDRDSGAVKCSRDDTSSQWTCAETSAKENFKGVQYDCNENVCRVVPPHFLGERMLSTDDRKARVESITNDALVIKDETTGQVVRDAVRETPMQFAIQDARGDYDILMLRHLPSALLLRLDNEWHFCCHGCIDERLVSRGLAPLEDKIPDGTKFVYETSNGYTRLRSEASSDASKYASHVTKWGDIAENMNAVDARTSMARGRPVIMVRDLEELANQLGLSQKYALISGHQDRVNCAYAHRHNDPPITEKWVPSTDEAQPYWDKLTVLRMSDELPNPLTLDYQRFLVTSSAYYAKRNAYLKRTCWLSLAQGNLLLHHATPKSTDGEFGPSDTLDDATFWQIIDHAVNVVRYPSEQAKMPEKWNLTRFFSLSYASSVLHAVRELLAKDVPANSICYQVLRAEDALVIFIGDLHSSIRSLGIILEWCRQIGCFEVDEEGNATARLQPNVYIVFLGDLIDRGPFGIEILVIVSLLKLATPEQVIILNGNHEDMNQYNAYGTKDELRGEYPEIGPPATQTRATGA